MINYQKEEFLDYRKKSKILKILKMRQLYQLYNINQWGNWRRGWFDQTMNIKTTFLSDLNDSKMYDTEMKY